MKFLWVISLSIILVFVGVTPIFAEDNSILLSTDKQSYMYGDTLILSIKTPQNHELSNVNIEIYDPNSRQIYSEKIDIVNDSIKYKILGSLWQKTGVYSVNVWIYGGMSGTASFEIVKKTESETNNNNSQIITEPISLSVTTNKKSYQYSDSITITGTTSEMIPEQFLTLQIINSDNMLIKVDQFRPSEYLDETSQDSHDTSSYSFSKGYITMGSLWSSDGVYTVKIFYLEHNAATQFEFVTKYDDDSTKTIPSNVITSSDAQLQTLIQNDTIQETLREILVNPAKSPQHYVDRYNNDKSYREWFDNTYPDYTINDVKYFDTQLAGFPSNTKPALYYIERYSNEKSYREWFDRNFVNTTIHEMLNFESVTCSDDKILVFEKRDNSPVCTTDTIASKLLERGWAVSFVR